MNFFPWILKKLRSNSHTFFTIDQICVNQRYELSLVANQNFRSRCRGRPYHMLWQSPSTAFSGILLVRVQEVRRCDTGKVVVLFQNFGYGNHVNCRELDAWIRGRFCGKWPHRTLWSSSTVNWWDWYNSHQLHCLLWRWDSREIFSKFRRKTSSSVRVLRLKKKMIRRDFHCTVSELERFLH